MTNEVQPLADVVHTQNNELWDVVAVLDCTINAIEAGAATDLSYIARVMRVAHDKVRAVQDEFQPFI